MALGGVPGGPWRLSAAKTKTEGRDHVFWRGGAPFFGGLLGRLGAPGGLLGVVLGRLGRRLGASWGGPDHLGGLWTLSWAPKTDPKPVPAAIFSWIPFVISF